MGSSPQNENLINQSVKKAAGGLDNGPRAARAMVSERHIQNAYEIGTSGLHLEEATKTYGDTQRIRDAHARGTAFGKLPADQREKLQKKHK